ncbi:hypothetical protein Ddc_24223 [Ditylenchus destructor]|nr:hypothetical protein Ddc_24223 [Ditylenchus destructor]
MKILLFAFICFLSLSEETQDHNDEAITIRGTVHISLNKHQPAPEHVSVFARPVKPYIEKDQKEVSASCGKGELISGDALSVISFKRYACTYRISVEKHNDGKIKVGASLEKEKENRPLGYKGQIDKHRVTKWSMPLSIPKNHEVGFVLDLRYTIAKLHLNKGIQTHSIEVDIEGKVHLRIPKSKRWFIYYHYKVPDTILISVRSETHPYAKTITSKKCTEEHVCSYEGKFKAGEEGEEFQVAAKLMSGSMSDFTIAHKIPEGKKAKLNFVLDLTKEKDYKKDKPRIFIDKDTIDQKNLFDQAIPGGDRKS